MKGLNLKGTIEVYDSDGKLEKVYHNRFVYSGRAFALEALFPVDNGTTNNYWLDEIANRATATEGDVYKRYFDVGTGTEANGVTGPTDSTPVLKSSWNGASIFDFKLDKPLFATARQEVTIRQRNGRTIEMQMQINQTDLGTENYENYIYEIGIFLGKNIFYPAHNPDQDGWDADDMNNAMLARAIFYQEDPTDATKWAVDPIYIADNDTKTIRYTMQDV